MKRLRRWLFNFAAVVSALMLVVIPFLWERSTRYADKISCCLSTDGVGNVLRSMSIDSSQHQLYVTISDAEIPETPPIASWKYPDGRRIWHQVYKPSPIVAGDLPSIRAVGMGIDRNQDVQRLY